MSVYIQYHGATAPSGPGASRSSSDTPQSVGFLWTSDQPHTDTSTRQHNTHNRQTSMPTGGIGIRSPSNRAAGDPRLGIGITFKAKEVLKNS